MCIMTNRKPLTDERLRDVERLRVVWEKAQEDAKAVGRKLTQADVSQACGWNTQGAFSAYINGRTPLNIPTVAKLSKFFGVKPEDISPEIAAEIAQAATSIESRPTSNIERTEFPFKQVPILTFVQAGNWREAILQDHHDEMVVVHIDVSDNTFAAKVLGTSMMPEFKEGDVIVVDTDVAPRPGDFVVAQNGNAEATFKKYRARGVSDDGIEVFDLVPLNADFATIHSTKGDVKIIGTVVQHIRLMR